MAKKRGVLGWVVGGAVILALFGVTRLYNLTYLPIFTDEAIYIRWSQIGSRDAAWRLISLVDGKQPLFTWIVMVLMRFFSDPVLAGRLVSVLAGFGSMIAIFFLGREVFRSTRVGLFASILYLLSPFALVYDRMALYDSLVATFSLWNLYIAILLVRRIRLDVALIFGITLGLGMLNKTSGFLSLYMVPLTLILFDWHRTGIIKRLFGWFLCILVAVLISQGMYNILRLSPLFGVIAQKNAIFVYPFAEWLKHPTEFFIGNIRGMFDWLISYLTWPVWIAALLPLFGLWRQPREKMLLYVWWAAPFAALALFARVLYPRFILFMTMPLLLLAAYSADGIMKKYGRTVFGFIVIGMMTIPSVWTDYLLVTNPAYAPIPQADRGQYVNDWPSGWGVREVKDFLLKESGRERIVVYTDGTFGLLPYGLEIWLVDKPNIEIHGIWPIPETPPPEVVNSVRKYPTYIVLNQLDEAPGKWNLTLLATYYKGLRKDRSLRLYKIAFPRVLP